MTGWRNITELKKQFKYCGDQVFLAENVIFTNPREVILHDRVRIDPFTLITTQLEVGSNVQICSHAVLGGGAKQKITLGNWVFIGYGSKLFTASESYLGDWGPVNEFWFDGNDIRRGDITFEDFSGVASDVIVMPGVTLLEGTTVGAKSFVYKSPDTNWSIWIGNPLTFHKHRDQIAVLELAADKSNWRYHNDD